MRGPQGFEMRLPVVEFEQAWQPALVSWTDEHVQEWIRIDMPVHENPAREVFDLTRRVGHRRLFERTFGIEVLDMPLQDFGPRIAAAIGGP